MKEGSLYSCFSEHREGKTLAVAGGKLLGRSQKYQKVNGLRMTYCFYNMKYVVYSLSGVKLGEVTMNS